MTTDNAKYTKLEKWDSLYKCFVLIDYYQLEVLWSKLLIKCVFVQFSSLGKTLLETKVQSTKASLVSNLQNQPDESNASVKEFDFNFVAVFFFVASYEIFR